MDNSNISFPTEGIILMYHRVADVAIDPWSLSVSPKYFNEQLGLLKQKFYPIKLSDLCMARTANDLPSPWVAITFDDGYADNYQVARRILEKHDMPATFFIVGGYLDSQHGFWWDELQDIFLKPGTLKSLSDISFRWDIPETDWKATADYTADDYERHKKWKWEDEDPTPRHGLFRKIYFFLRAQAEEQRQIIMKNLRLLQKPSKEPLATRYLLSSEEIKLLAQENLFEIGAHTMTHLDLDSLSKSQQLTEIIESKNALEKLIDKPVISFSYPYGIKSTDTVALVQEAGFSCACSVEEGIVQETTNLYDMPRLGMKNWDAYQLYEKLHEMLQR